MTTLRIAVHIRSAIMSHLLLQSGTWYRLSRAPSTIDQDSCQIFPAKSRRHIREDKSIVIQVACLKMMKDRHRQHRFLRAPTLVVWWESHAYAMQPYHGDEAGPSSSRTHATVSKPEFVSRLRASSTIVASRPCIAVGCDTACRLDPSRRGGSVSQGRVCIETLLFDYIDDGVKFDRLQSQSFNPQLAKDPASWMQIVIAHSVGREEELKRSRVRNLAVRLLE